MLETDDNLTKTYLLVFTEIGNKFKFINKTKKQQKTSNAKQTWFILKIIYTTKESKEKKKNWMAIAEEQGIDLKVQFEV